MRPIWHNRAKFREDRSIRWCDIAIFVIFKMVTAAVFIFNFHDINVKICSTWLHLCRSAMFVLIYRDELSSLVIFAHPLLRHRVMPKKYIVTYERFVPAPPSHDSTILSQLASRQQWLQPDATTQKVQGTKVRRYNWHSAGFLGWPFPMLKYLYIFQIKYTEAILSNSTRKLLWFEVSKMPTAV